METDLPQITGGQKEILALDHQFLFLESFALNGLCWPKVGHWLMRFVHVQRIEDRHSLSHIAQRNKTRMLGSIVSRLASPTQDGMKHPEIHKKVEVRNLLEMPRNHVGEGVLPRTDYWTDNWHCRVTSRVAPCSNKARLKRVIQTSLKCAEKKQETKIHAKRSVYVFSLARWLFLHKIAASSKHKPDD